MKRLETNNHELQLKLKKISAVSHSRTDYDWWRLVLLNPTLNRPGQIASGALRREKPLRRTRFFGRAHFALQKRKNVVVVVVVAVFVAAWFI